MKIPSLTICFLPAVLLVLGNQTHVAAAPSSDLGIGDIPAAILNLLLSPALQVSQLNIEMSVLTLLLNTASLNFDVVTPVPLVEITVDRMSAQIGTQGTPFFSFNQTFSNFVLSGLNPINSGIVPNVELTQGALQTLNVISNTRFDILSATYNLRVLTVNGTGGIPLSLPAAQLSVPTKLDFQCP
ncbi:hypothetical protein A7U60_g2643 [Sanghuangporus baumii]|uniref:Uncharacterized protein n=1 Tax=Sanghuangporus baumii TaxID=108892 RepID=A0A9Q5NAS7_SANBA|nr:hypothetical protein A7U60_g2643 [Sanghuangporus baumii]